MSLFRLPKFKAITSTVQRIQGRLAKGSERSVSERAYRSLQIDPLEERQLLSLSPGHIDDSLVNEDPIELHYDENLLYGPTTLAGQSIAVDNDGDFVVAWSTYDPLYETDPLTGDPIIDPATGLPKPLVDPETGMAMTDANIYARYFTDESQRVTLPEAAGETALPGGFGWFSLVYGGNEVQKLSITPTYAPLSQTPGSGFDIIEGVNQQEALSGTFTLGFDVSGDGTVSGSETVSVVFDELPAFGETAVEHLQSTALELQTGLQGLGGALSDVIVDAINPHEYLIRFGDASAGRDMPELTVESFHFDTGFLPAVMTSTVTEPIDLGPIPISPTDPATTAFSIEQAFARTARNTLIGPIDFPPPDRIPSDSLELTQGPYVGPQVMRTPLPEVAVRANGKTEFDITFIGDSGKKDHQELVVTKVVDSMGNVLHDRDDPGNQSAEIDVVTLKEPSAQFRVNPIEHDNPITVLPDLYNQTSPSVAMDADGEFVISWQSDVPNWENFGSVSDIYARRFTASGLVDSSVFVPGQVVPGVRSHAVASAIDTQIIKFDAQGTPPLTGPFQLEIAGHTTDTIEMNSDDLPGVAAAIEAELLEAGYEDVAVEVLSTTDPYQFRVTFGGESGGVDQPSITYVPLLDPVSGLPMIGASVTIEDETDDLYTFRVNQMTSNRQYDPSVGMDDAGNFVVAWANGGQDISFFNGISAQRFDRHGQRLGNEFQVSTEDTAIHYEPNVAMSPDGHTAITWTRTSDPNYLVPDDYLSSTLASVYAQDGTALVDEVDIGGAAGANAAFDMNNNVVFAWYELRDVDGHGQVSAGIYAKMYRLYNDGGDVDFTEIREEFRANSPSFDPDSTTVWPGDQRNPHVAVDADGDLVITYDGFGPDVSEWVDPSLTDLLGTFDAYLASQINVDRNADLLPFYDPMLTPFMTMTDAGSVDSGIEDILMEARLFYNATDSQLGRLRAILDDAAGLLRGEAWGALFSRWDADPQNGELNILYGDSIANATRDGHNSRYFISLDQDIVGGNFTLRFTTDYPWNPLVGTNDAAVPVVLYPDTTTIDMDATGANIEAALQGMAFTGTNWPESPTTVHYGSVEVRPVFGFEAEQRVGTPWDITTNWGLSSIGSNVIYYGGTIDTTDYIWEVTLQGELHDNLENLLYVSANGLEMAGIPEVQNLTFNVTDDGWFAVEIGNDQSGDILFDSTNPDAVAANIQAELEAMGYDDVVVVFSWLDSFGSTFTFEVTFAGDSAGQDVDPIEVIDAEDHSVDDGDPMLDASTYSTEIVKGMQPDPPDPVVAPYALGDEGTRQTHVSIGMEPDGDFAMVWTQYDRYSDLSYSNTNIYYRTFNEETDTAGPMITDLIAPSGESVDPAGMIEGPLQHIVLTFDEELAQYDDEKIAWAIAERDLAIASGLPIPGDVSAVLDSVTNIENYRLLQNGAELPDTILRVEFGMSKAADLADAYGLNPIPSNKWEAVITFDGNGPDPGVTPLLSGIFTIETVTPVPDLLAAVSQSGIRDKSGLPLNHTGYAPGGYNVSRDFIVAISSDGTDTPVTIDPSVGFGSNGRTYPETPGAVAVDSDGDHVVTWTAYDPNLQRERVFVRAYEADGTPALTRPFYFQVTPPATDPAFADDDQRYATVACDADGDFVVTWTNFRDTDGDGIREEQDIYMRRFDANGFPVSDPMRVNTYATNNQKWSSVAMDVDGEFVITWSSYSQEDNNQLGTGYGIYARQFDSFGQPLAPEFRVNVTTVGNQQFSSVVMDEDGDFVVVWTSDQNGVGDDIVARRFAGDGAPQPGPLTGEILVNAVTDGNQRYPDIATNLAGDEFVVTWSSSGQDGSGWGVYAVVLDQDLVPTDPAGEFLVNTTVDGNQMFSSVAMDYEGEFTIVWSGYGDQPAEEDVDRSGVFYQRYGFTTTQEPVVDDNGDPVLDDDGNETFVTVTSTGPLGLEARINYTVEGSQHVPSIGSDADGNFVVAWTGETGTSGITDVFATVSYRTLPNLDTTGPIVTGVREANGNRMLENGAVSGIGELIVLFNEDLSELDGTSGLSSVLNPNNWSLERNGTELVGAIKSITFGLSEWQSRKYEARVVLDGNGMEFDPNGTVPQLLPGDYVLTVRDLITDGVAPLDGDYDSVPGTDPAGTGQDGYKFSFTVVTQGPQTGAEFRINESTIFDQRLAENGGTGYATEYSSRAMAVDHDGDFVVVWTSTGQDDPSDPYGTGVYYRMFDRDNTPLTPETRVNTTTEGSQLNASVAIDADGDFVVVWESHGHGPDGSSDIFGQRFSSIGEPVGDEFRINSDIYADQYNPAVAMDDAGNFTVVWASSAGQSFSYFHNIKGQLFDYNGQPVGAEFQINEQDLPGTGSSNEGHEGNPTVAMDPAGNIIVAWERVTAQQNGVVTESDIAGRLFDPTGTPQGGEQTFGAGGAAGGPSERAARNPQLTTDPAGNFIVVWESYNGTDYDIAYEMYDVTGAGIGGGAISEPVFEGHQVNPSVAIDADGDFAVVWNGNGGETNPLDPADPNLWGDLDNEGVFIRSFHAGRDFVTPQSRVNRTQGRIQQFPTIGMESDGDIIVVWSGAGVGDYHGIFARRYDEALDTAGPLMTEVRLSDRTRIDDQEPMVATPQELIVVFDEAMMTQGPDRVTNPENWVLLRNGVEMEDAISGITYELNPATNKFEAVVRFAAPLTGGLYTLTALEPIADDPATPATNEGRSGLRDAVGNALSRSGLIPNGAALSHDFVLGLAAGDASITEPWPVVDGATQPTTPGAVAVDADGDHVVAITATDLLTGKEKAYVRLYDASGSAAMTAPVLFPVTSEAEFINDTQRFASVAVDADGDVVVAWTNLRDTNGDGTADEHDVYARRFNAAGQPLGTAFRVNQYTNGTQKWSSVAMDADGDFVVTWSSYGQESGTGELGFGYGVYARRYDSQGEPIADEMLVNTTIDGDQQFASVAMDADGDFVVTWTSSQNGVDNDIYARGFDAATETFGAETQVNTTGAGDQLHSDVAIDLPGGSFVVTWSGSAGQDGDGFGVFARQFELAAGAIAPTSDEIQVNTTTLGDQQFASVGMDHAGNFTVAWSGFGEQEYQEDESGSGVFYQRFDSAAAPIGGETRATIVTDGHQFAPSISTDGKGNFVIVFTGDKAGTASTDVYRFLSTNYLSVDDADGALVTDVTLTDGTRLAQGETVPETAGDVTQLVVLFSEDLSVRGGAAGADSVLNPANWKLYHNGAEISGAITGITFGRSMLSRKYQAVITLDGNGMIGGAPALAAGDYVLTVRDSIHDVYTPDVDGNFFGGNALDGDFDAVPGATAAGPGVDGYRFEFNIGGTSVDNPLQNGRTHAETPGAMAVDADGDHVVAWTVFDTSLGRDRIYVQLFDANGQPTAHAPHPFPITPTGVHPEFYADDQRYASVAIDADGDFVVTWTNIRGGEHDVYARRYSSTGNPLGMPFLVNTYTNNQQKWSDVAVDRDGDFVITWSSYGQEEAGGQLGYGNGVYARRYDSFGIPMGPEMRVNQTVVGDQQYASVAMDADGDFVVTWTSEQSGPGDDVFARAFSSAGVALGDEVPVNTTTVGEQRYPSIAADLAGQNFIITWSSSAQDGNGWGVFARQFTADDEAGLVAAAGEFQVNTTVDGNQMFSAAAMDHQGDFVITWSGNGQQDGEADEFGSGVFYQRYDSAGATIGGETRANLITGGDQTLPSIGSDGTGNVVIAWTGDNPSTGSTSVYKMLSAGRIPVADVDGPIVSDVFLPGHTRVLEGDVLENLDITTMLVAFGENLSVEDGLIGPESVLNTSNWALERNGNELLDGIASVDFAYNPFTRKYEAVVAFDGNGQAPGVTELPAGHYTIIVQDDVTDGMNRLDSDFDGTPGTDLATMGLEGYRFSFYVAAGPQFGPEYRVNDDTAPRQEIGTPHGTGTGMEDSTQSMALDHDGDFVVVWTAYGQDDPSDVDGAGVYFRMYDRNDVPLTPVTRVNQTIVGNQWRPSVAMDPDGEFVIAWQGDDFDPDGSDAVFVRRYSSIGEPLGGEVRANITTLHDQGNPAVAMDYDGNFVVAWGTSAKPFGYFNDIRAQLFNYEGERTGPEFLVNSVNIPGIAGAPGGAWEVRPSAAMDDDGNFMIAWDQLVTQTNGVVTDGEVAARMFDATGTPLGVEFLVDGGGGAVNRPGARNPQLTADRAGNFTIVWESYTGNDYDVFYQEYDATGGAGAGAQLNQAEFDGDQVNPSVARDDNGRLAAVWNGNGGQTDPLNPADVNLYGDLDDEGVFIRQLDETAEFITVQTRVNRTATGIQHFPTIGMEPDGDRLVVWGGAGVGDRDGVYVRRYNETLDTVGPQVTGITLPSGQRIPHDQQIDEPLQAIIIVFDEEMMTDGLSSVTDPRNYRLLREGSEILGGIREVHFGLNKASEMSPEFGLSAKPTNKWEAVLILDANGNGPGVLPLVDGRYEIVALSSLRDVTGNPLNSTGLNPNGAPVSQVIGITVPSPTGEQRIAGDQTGGEYTHPHSPQAVAEDADGDYVAVWTSTTPGKEGVWAKLYDIDWTTDEFGERVRTDIVGGVKEILVAEGTPGDEPTQAYASVARDIDGDFVVTWSSHDDETGWDVYARRYDATGTALGEAFRVNAEARSDQMYSTVGMDGDGDFVISWQSFDQDGSGWGIYAQRYNIEGAPIGGTNELQVLRFIGRPTGTFKLSWDHDGLPATADRETEAITYTGNTAAVVDEIEAKLKAIGADVALQAVSQDEIVIRFVGTQAGLDHAQIWVSDADMTGDAGAQVQAYTAIDGSPGEFLVNDTTENNQRFPTVSMSTLGSFVVTWTSAGQDGDAEWETNIYAKQFPSNDVIRDASSQTSAYQSQAEWGNWIEGARYTPFIVSVDDPINHEVVPGSGADGVVELNVMTLFGGGLGSGTLLTTGTHILTAAHNVADPFGNLAAMAIDVAFDLPTGRVTIPASDVFIHPDYNGNPFTGNDIAIITLAGMAPAEAERHDIYRGSDEIGRVGTKYGYGMNGTGDIGSVAGPDGIKRFGQNQYEAFGGLLGASDMLLAYDFDNGLPQNDAFGQQFSITDLGLGLDEVCGAPGDSGGPTFIDGLIAGVTTGGIALPGSHDLIAGIQSSFGDFGVDTRVSLFADWIDQVTAGTPEFLVNQTIEGDQKWSAVALDSSGDFVITWTGYGQDLIGEGYGPSFGGEEGVFARRYHSGGFPGGLVDGADNEFQVNTFAQYEQQHSRIAMDADGDFVISWESFQDRNDDSTSPEAADSFGIYAQRYARTERLQQVPVLDEDGFPVVDGLGNPVFEYADPALGPNGAIGGELAINTTKAGEQRYPGVAIDDTGDFLVVWSGNGEGSPQGIFSQRYDKIEDVAGPTVGDVLNVTESGAGVELERVQEFDLLYPDVTQFVVTFGENLSTKSGASGENSILNRRNWGLSKDGVGLSGSIVSVEFGLSEAYPAMRDAASNKYEAVITFDGNPLEPGLQPLEPGTYELTISDAVQDLFGNALDGDFDGSPNGNFRRNFTIFSNSPGPDPDDPDGPTDPDPNEEDQPINSITGGDQEQPAVASNAAGDHVIVWVTRDSLGDGNIVGQRFDNFGRPVGNEFLISTEDVGDQTDPDVAMDAFGNFVVTWSGEGPTDESGIYAKTFDPFGVPLGDQFRVNQLWQSDQTKPSASMDQNGDFVITFTSVNQEDDDHAIYARRFNFLGEPLSTEFRVNTTTHEVQTDSDVAMDVDGNFVVVWASFNQDGGSWGIFGQRYNAEGGKIGGEFAVNSHAENRQVQAQIAMDLAGNFVVTWASQLQDGDGYGVYARRFNANASPLDTREFLVNQTTDSWQRHPAVDMDDSGNFVIAWTSMGQDNVEAVDEGIFARMYNADGSDYLVESTGQPVGEFRINATIDGDQIYPAVAVDSDGDYVIAWVGPDHTMPVVDPDAPVDPDDPDAIVDLDPTDIYSRVILINPQIDDVGGDGEWNNPDDPGSSTSIQLPGTAGDDLFEVGPGSVPGTWSVRLNGVVLPVEPTITSVGFDGLGGNDTVKIIGTDADETAELWPTSGIVRSGNYSVSFGNVESISVDAAGGDDELTLYDSAGDDTFSAGPGGAAMLGDSIDIATLGFETVLAHATAGGTDVAKLFDSPGDDHFHSNPQYGELSGDGFRARAIGFEGTHGYATNGGVDVAKLFDSVGDDTFYADPSQAALYGEGFYNRVKHFEAVHAYGESGGVDQAEMHDSAGDDSFYGSPTESSLYGDGFYNRVKSFDSVDAYSDAGGVDHADLYDSTGDDTFSAGPGGAAMFGDQIDIATFNFENVVGYAYEGGLDVAKLFDSPGDDRFHSNPQYGQLSGDGFLLKAVGFEGTHGYATSGGVDLAQMFDSAGDDRMYGDPTEASLYGDGYYNRVKYFEGTHAYADNGGFDLADLHGSEGNDTYDGTATQGALFGDGFYNRAKSFDQVNAHADEGGTDKAVLHDATLTGGTTQPVGDIAKIDWLYEFEECFTTEGESDEQIEQAVDDVLRAYWD